MNIDRRAVVGKSVFSCQFVSARREKDKNDNRVWVFVGVALLRAEKKFQLV